MGYPNFPLAHGIPNYVPKMFLVTTKFCSCVSALSEIFKGTDRVKGSELS